MHETNPNPAAPCLDVIYEGGVSPHSVESDMSSWPLQVANRKLVGIVSETRCEFHRVDQTSAFKAKMKVSLMLNRL